MLSDKLIEGYVRTREGVVKAGGYGLQVLGLQVLGSLSVERVERIEGQADNVVGSSLGATLKLIQKVVLNQDVEGDEEDYE